MEKYIAGIFGFCLGLLGLYTCFAQLRNFSKLDSWKTTKGKVFERGVVESEAGNVRNAGQKFNPLVRYSYQVDNQDFTNDAIYPKHLQGYSAGSSDWAEKEAKKFDDDVTVFYNPENPADSFLRMPSKTTFYIIGIASLIIIFFAGFVLIFGVDNWTGLFK